MTYIITATGYRGRRRVQKAYYGDTMREAIDEFRKEYSRTRYEIEDCRQAQFKELKEGAY